MVNYMRLTQALIISAALAAVVTGISPPANTFRNSAVRQANTSEELCPAVRRCLNRMEMGRPCDVLPIPAGSEVAMAGPMGFNLDLQREGVWTYYDGVFITLMIASDDRFLFVDLPDAPVSNKPDGSMTRTTDAAEIIIGDTIPTRFDIIYTHSHFDHIGAATRFVNYMSGRYPDADIFIWGTQETSDDISRAESERAPPPNVIVEPEGRTITVNENLELQLRIIQGHTNNDLAVFIPRSNDMPSILVHPDVVFPGWAPFTSLAFSENFRLYMESHRGILAFDFDIFNGFHNKLGTRESVETNLEYTQDLLEAAKAGIAAIGNPELIAGGILDFMDPTAAEFGNVWYAATQVANPLRARECARIMLEKWGCRLAGQDFVGMENCISAVRFELNEN